MHSLAMAQSILQAALSEVERYDGKRIKAISVKMGDENFMESDSLQFCLEAIAKGTVAEGARVKVELVGAATRSIECAPVLPVGEHLPICPRCSDGSPEMLAGGDSLLVTLELD